jgi:type II secretory pathway component GspD/PulD (secretin)
LYSAFGSRAELLPAQESGRSPGFMVFNSAAPPGSPPRSEQEMAFGVAVDIQRNELRVAGPPDTIRNVAELLRRLDQLPASTKAGGPRLVAMEQSKLGIAQRLGPQLKQIQTARRRSGGNDHATAGTGRLLAQAAQAQPAEQVPPTPPGPGETTETLPADREALLRILLDGLRSEVKMEVIPELNLLMLTGNEADVQKVVEIINAIEQLAIGTTPAVDVYFLQHVDSQSLATLLTTSYEQLGTLRSRTQGAGAPTGAAASFVPVVKPNAVLILAPQTMLDEIHSLIGNLDQPIDPTAEVEVFFLKHAVASQVVTNLREFYNARPGLGTKMLATADIRSNAVVVQAQPNDLTEISTFIRQIDRAGPDSVNRLQVFRLNNAIADETADFLNALLQSVLSPPTGVAGAQQAAVGGAGAQTTQTLREPKAVVLEYVANNPSAQGLVSAGILQDERLVRSGLLSDIRVSADIRTNSLTVTAPEASMELMEELIRVLDQPSATIAEIKVFPLKNADATSAVTVLETIFAASQQQQQQQQIGIQVAGAEDASSALIPLRFSADPRTNTVVAIGAAEAMDMVQGILFRLDESDPRTREARVIRLKNSPADLAATAINQFLADQRALAQLDPDRISTSQLLQQEIIVTPDTVTNSLIISATPSYIPMIEKLVTDLDREPQQVVIQALLVEVELNDTDEFGVEIGFQDSLLFDRSILTAEDITTISTTETTPGGNQITTTNIISQAAQPGFLFNNNPLGNNTATPGSGKVGTQGLANFALGRVNDSLGFGGLVLSASSESVSMLIRALSAHRTVNVLSRPMVLALDNQLAQVQVGQEVPRVEDITITNNVATPIVNYDSAGIILTVSPRISSDGQIVMEVAAEKSEYTGAGVPIFTDVNTGNVIESPIKDITNALTTVKVPDGQTVVVGGMITKREVHDERKVPWLGDLPLVGPAFRTDIRTMRRTELLIFLTPRIIHNDADSEMIKEVEIGRIHYFVDQVEEVHGPLFGIPGAPQTTPEAPSPAMDPSLVPPLPGAPVPPPAETSAASDMDRPRWGLFGKSRVQQASHTRVEQH